MSEYRAVTLLKTSETALLRGGRGARGYSFTGNLELPSMYLAVEVQQLAVRLADVGNCTIQPVNLHVRNSMKIGKKTYVNNWCELLKLKCQSPLLEKVAAGMLVHCR